MKKKKYTDPEFLIFELEVSDIITTSDPGGSGGSNPPIPDDPEQDIGEWDTVM